MKKMISSKAGDCKGITLREDGVFDGIKVRVERRKQDKGRAMLEQKVGRREQRLVMLKTLMIVISEEVRYLMIII